MLHMNLWHVDTKHKYMCYVLYFSIGRLLEMCNCHLLETIHPNNHVFVEIRSNNTMFSHYQLKYLYSINLVLQNVMIKYKLTSEKKTILQIPCNFLPWSKLVIFNFIVTNSTERTSTYILCATKSDNLMCTTQCYTSIANVQEDS